jgi:hypothetical protein
VKRTPHHWSQSRARTLLAVGAAAVLEVSIAVGLPFHIEVSEQVATEGHVALQSVSHPLHVQQHLVERDVG